VGLYLFVSFLFGAMTPFVVGYMGDIWDLNVGFLFPAVFVTIGAIYIVLLMRRVKKQRVSTGITL
jgi:hypothetical protein